MKTIITLISSLLMASCTVKAQPTASFCKLMLVGEDLLSIRHITDMKVSGDSLYFVYETEEGFGQRFIRRAIIDKEANKLSIGKEIGKRDDGYYASYMPYLFFDIDGKAHIVNQDDCEILDLSGNEGLTKTKEYIITGNSIVPFSLSRYVQDVFMVGSHTYLFIGREPNGGAQYAMLSNTVTERIDTIRKIAIKSEMQAWMPNAGELVYSKRYNRMAFAYRLHPIIDFFDMNGKKIIKQLRLAHDTFDAKTLKEADFEELNPLHIVDVTSSKDYLFVLYWGYKYADSRSKANASMIYQIDWNGEVVNRYKVNTPLRRITFYDENMLIGWNGNGFIKISLKP